ncbi:MAG: hypothetical protein HUU15_08690 [Candidatus Brocadiae bacterium]|nr:hypothetical protein [Candidatus Brocadiia bacterium]
MRTDEARRARQESQASLRLAQGQRMAAYSINLLSENPTAALLIATEAARRAPGTASTNALWTALCELLERSRFLGHEHNVTDGEFSPDGLRVATSGADFTARIWDPATGVELQRLEGHRSSVDRVAWSPDGTRLLTVPGDPALERHAAFQPKGSIDVAPRIWDTATGQCLRVLNGHTGVLHGASWAPGGRVLSWSADATVRLWGADGDATVFRTPWPVYEAAISADGRWVAAVPMFETAGLLWRVESPSEPRPLEGHTREGVRFDFAADSRSILTLCRAGRVLRRDLETLAILQDFRILRPAVDNPGGPPDRQILVYKAIHHPDGKRVALQSDLGIHVLTSDFSKELSFCEFPEGRLTHRNLDRDWTRGLIWIGPGAVARDLATGKDLVRFRGHEYNLEFACFSPDGRRMISGGRDRAAIVWDTAPGACLPTFGWGATQKQVFTNLDGTIALVRGPDGGLEKRDNATGKLLASWPFEGPISSIRVSGNDRHFILNSPGAQELLVGDMDKGPIGNISLNGLLPWTQFSRNGEWLLAAIGGGEARIVEMATLKPGPIFKTPPVTYDFAAISDDGSVFAMIDAATATVAVYDSADQHLVCRATGHTGWTISTAFGADGTLYSTAMDASVRAWNPRTGEFLRTGRWPLIQETFIVMGRRGDVLALDTGYTARFYDAHTLDDIGALPKSCSSPVSFTPDERFAVVRRAGVILHLPMDALRFAESVAPREMTPLEQRGLADSRAEADEYAAAYAKRHPRASTSLQRGNRALQAGNWALALEHAAEARRLRSPGPELPVLSARALGLQAAGLKEDEQARVAALDAAFEALSEAIDRGYRDVETLESDSALAPLRQDSRWAALLSRAKRLPWE